VARVLPHSLRHTITYPPARPRVPTTPHDTGTVARAAQLGVVHAAHGIEISPGAAVIEPRRSAQLSGPSRAV
jgi:hypothetical protein